MKLLELCKYMKPAGFWMEISFRDTKSDIYPDRDCYVVKIKHG